MAWAKSRPDRCEACGEPYFPGETLVGWGNMWKPRAYRTHRCGGARPHRARDDEEVAVNTRIHRHVEAGRGDVPHGYHRPFMTVEDVRYSYSSDKNRLLLLAQAEAWGSNCYGCRKPKTFRDCRSTTLCQGTLGGGDPDFDVDTSSAPRQALIGAHANVQYHAGRRLHRRVQPLLRR